MVKPASARCKATTAAGSPCSAQPIRDDGHCYWHSPAIAAERDAARRRGGANKSNKTRMAKASQGMAMDEVQILLAAVLKGTITGRFTPGQASAAAAVARAMATIHQSVQLEQRLAEVEAALGVHERRNA